MQRPRIPVWVAATWPHRGPIRRATRWDGLFPIDLAGPEELAELGQDIRPARAGDAPFDLVVEVPPGADVRPWEAAGAGFAGCASRGDGRVVGLRYLARQHAWAGPVNFATQRATVITAIQDAGYLYIPGGRRDHLHAIDALYLHRLIT